MTEQYVLTEIIGQLIEHDLGVKVEIAKASAAEPRTFSRRC